MKIRKRNGNLEKLDINQIYKQLEPATDGTKLKPDDIALNARISFKDGMLTTELQELLIRASLDLVDVDNIDGDKVAARLYLYDMYHTIKRNYFTDKVEGDVYKAITFGDYYNFNKDLLTYDISKFDIIALNNSIKPENDLLFTYLGITTLKERYLLTSLDKLRELPQHALMSLACFLAQNEKDATYWALEFYSIMTELEYLPGTPTLNNGRKLNGNCYSCAVGSAPDDIVGIFDAYKIIALGSKYGSGWGFDWSKIRANGSTIQDKFDVAGGLIPFLKIVNCISIAVNQLGVRLGAINVTLESWHMDILDFIDLKKNGGEDKRRAKELFITVSCSDLFMERVDNNEMFTLFDPYDTRELTELWGTEFEDKYRYYEELAKTNPEYFANQPQQINAKDLWKKFQTMFWETGIPFLYYKDTANREFFKDIKEEFIESGELGLIRSANLCQEYLSPIKDDEVTVCNLGSVNLAKLTTKEKMERVIRIATRMLDNVIDVTTYQIPNTEATQKTRRSIGLGVCGEAEAIANLGIMYGSDEHLEWIDETYGMFEYYSDQASIDLGKEKGACKYSKHGYRNLHRRCIAPTSTISILMGTSQAHEAVFDKVWIEDNIIGTIKLTAPNLNVNNYAFYINAYEVEQEKAVKATARRQKRIDMGISHNFYFNTATTKGKDVYDVNMLAYKLGFKTTYYTRSKSLKLNDLEKKEDKIVCSGCQN